eukprot:6742068-Lingulodinium_polyedra.AAC.1
MLVAGLHLCLIGCHVPVSLAREPFDLAGPACVRGGHNLSVGALAFHPCSCIACVQARPLRRGPPCCPRSARGCANLYVLLGALRARGCGRPG